MSEMKERRIIECANERYAVNKPNMEKFTQVYKFLCGIAEEEGGEVSCFDIRSEPTHAGVSVEVSTLDLHKDSMSQFIDILQYVDVLDIKSTEEGNLLISAIVNHVWEDAK